MMNSPEILGFAGIGVVVIAYAPQIIHLRKEHCSAGISLKAYSLWCVSSALFLIHAVMIRDIVFTVVQLINLVAIIDITLLVKRYGGYVCLTHLQAQQGRTAIRRTFFGARRYGG
jgi:uncharacterized protein with PQ loop repeat